MAPSFLLAGVASASEIRRGLAKVAASDLSCSGDACGEDMTSLDRGAMMIMEERSFVLEESAEAVVTGGEGDKAVRKLCSFAVSGIFWDFLPRASSGTFFIGTDTERDEEEDTEEDELSIFWTENALDRGVSFGLTASTLASTEIEGFD